jgi:predicted nucleic acid-binding protein
VSSGYLIDTNVPSEVIRPAPDERVASWLEQHSSLHLSVISVGELMRGMELLPLGKKRSQLETWFTQALLPLVHNRILPVNESISRRWAVLSAKRQMSGRPLNMADGLIAATALEYDLTLVTRNVSDFSGLGVLLVNPWEANS